MLNLLNPIKIIVLLTFLAGVFFLEKSKRDNKLLFAIVCVCFINEVGSLILKYNKLSINSLFTIDVVLHHSLWIILIGRHLSGGKMKAILLGYLIVSALNFFFVEGMDNFNYYSFVSGALVYTILFTYISYKKLREENLGFFTSNHMILLFSPVMFFLGLSFMFCFKSHQLTSTLLFGDVKLYTFINYSVNIIYYTLINIYILKERKQTHV
ncbi:hypothetical protein [Flavobacterium sp.]